MRFKEITLSLPWKIGSVRIEPNYAQRDAAWSLYVELVTRISTETLYEGEGILREALNSLYRLFDITRDILKKAGSQVGPNHNQVGGIAIAALNEGLRPFLAEWHPKLQLWESTRPADVSIKEWEVRWDDEAKMRAALKRLTSDLAQYAKALAQIAGVKEEKEE